MPIVLGFQDQIGSLIKMIIIDSGQRRKQDKTARSKKCLGGLADG